MLIHKTDMASYGWEVVRNSWSGERSRLRDDPAPKLQLASWIQFDVARKLAEACGMNLDEMIAAARKPGFKPMPLPAKLAGAHRQQGALVSTPTTWSRELPAPIPSSKDQAVIYTAHYDHLGIVPACPATTSTTARRTTRTGCGILLEIARAFACAPQQPPKRSIYFASVTGEEQGLRGSEYLGKHPPVPAQDIALDLNYDDVPHAGRARKK